jgi:hypothetical protein
MNEMTKYDDGSPVGEPTRRMLAFFQWEHLPEDLQPVSAACSSLAHEMARTLPDGPELTAGLRKLLEAKDCFVRASVEARNG